ncbi:MAG: hypothetical protein V1790_18965 [Planctomycetota bacterium]
MKKGSYRRLLAVSLFGVVCTGLSTGCNTTGKNVWFGFTAGLGGIPASIVGNYLANLVLGATTTP